MLGEDPTLMCNLCIKYKLHDAFKQIHPNAPEFTTYIWGTKRLDYILISHDIRPAAVGYN